MEITNQQHEVSFGDYCDKCKHYALDEDQEPCDECLANPVNVNSRKPLYFVADKNTKECCK